MIYGIGIDIVDIARFRAAMKRRGERFLRRLFTREELSYCMSQRFPERHLSARFACKVSFFKALGRRMRFSDVEVTRDPSGSPRLRAAGLGKGFKSNISMSHDGALSVAETILEREP